MILLPVDLPGLISSLTSLSWNPRSATFLLWDLEQVTSPPWALVFPSVRWGQYQFLPHHRLQGLKVNAALRTARSAFCCSCNSCYSRHPCSIKLELVNNESTGPEGNTALGSHEPLGTTLLSNRQYISLFYVCFYLKTPSLIHIVDSLTWNSRPTAL